MQKQTEEAFARYAQASEARMDQEVAGSGNFLWVDALALDGRDQAYAQGWYDNRRKIQTVVVAGVGAVWLITVAVALWRVPARQRRYLPAAIAVFTLLCFVGVRTISLHQIDAVMYHRDFAGAQIGTVGELTLLAVAVALTAWPPPLGTSVEYRRPAAVR